MALSGTYGTNVGSHWRLQCDWTATQDTSANTSTITAKLYWMATDSYGAVSSSASKTSAQKINGGAWSTETVTAGLSANQKKLINTATWTVNHNSDGTCSFSLDAYFSAEVTLGGTYYGTINLTQTTFTLNTIPRQSTMTTSAWWTAGGDRTISIDRNSTSYSHVVEIYVKDTGGTWRNIKNISFSTSQTSLSTSFTTTEKTSIFSYLAQRATCDSRMILKTYSGATYIGSNTYDGTVTSPSPTKTDASMIKSVYVGDTVNILLAPNDTEFTHTVSIVAGSFTKTFTSVVTTASWTPDSTEQPTLYALFPNTSTLSGSIKTTTYYNGVVVQTQQSETFTFSANPATSAPTFLSSQISYYDSNTTTTAMTGNNKNIIQKQSTVVAQILSSATGKNGATINHYVISSSGAEVVTPNATIGNFTLGTVDSAQNVSLTVKAVDSRGLSTAVNVTMTMIPWTAPTISLSVARLNNFEATTNIQPSGNMSSVNGANQVMILQYRTKQKGTSTWSGWTNVSSSYSLGKWSGSASPSLDSTLAFDIEVQMADKFVSVSATSSVGAGTPLMFIDSGKNSVGFGKFPTGTNSYEFAGVVDATGQITGHNGLLVDNGYFEVGTYNDTTYGTGKMQAYWDGVNKQFKLIGRDGAGTAVTMEMLISGSRVHTDGNVLLDRGYTSVTTTSTTASSQVAISFSKTFPTSPTIGLTISSITNPAFLHVSVTGNSTTGFNLNVIRTSATGTFTVYWSALWLP